MSLTCSAASCGIRILSELGGYGSKEALLQDALDTAYDEDGEILRFSQIIFSDHLTDGNRKLPKNKLYGEILAKYIRDNKLGKLVESPVIKNRNTGNMIKTWIWNVTNVRKLKKALNWKAPQNEGRGNGYYW